MRKDVFNKPSGLLTRLHLSHCHFHLVINHVHYCFRGYDKRGCHSFRQDREARNLQAELLTEIINQARGKVIEHKERKYMVGYHPAVRFYRDDLGEKVKEDFALLKRTIKKLLL